MAWSGATAIGGANNKTSGTTLSFSPSATVPANAIVLVAIASDNIQTTNGASSNISVSDSQGHTYTRVAEWTFGGGGAGSGATVGLFATRATAGLATTDTITATWSAAVTAKAMMGHYRTVASGNTFEVQGTAGATGTSATPSVTLSGQPSGTEFVWHGVVALEGAPTWTDDADYTEARQTRGTTGGGAATNISGCSAARRSSTLTSDTYNPTSSASGDWAAILVTLKEVTAAVDVTVTATVADTAGDAPTPTVATDAVVGATVTDSAADALAASVTIGSDAVVTSPVADLAGDAVPPTVSTTSSATVSARVADSTGDAPAAAASAGATVLSSVADTAADAPQPTISAGATVQARPSDAAGDAPVPSVSTQANVSVAATVSDGTADALPASVLAGGSVTVVVVPCDAAADAPSPSLSLGVTVVAPAQDAAADAPVPAVSATTGVVILATAADAGADVLLVTVTAEAPGLDQPGIAWVGVSALARAAPSVSPLGVAQVVDRARHAARANDERAL